MMRKIKVVLLFSLIAFATTAIGASQRFRASMMIAQPSRTTVQGLYGHAFIRLQYPAEKLDYCFTLETTNDDEHAWDIITGNYTTSIMAFPTSQYMAQFRRQQRTVMQLPLNLTDKEIQTLWRTLDEAVVDTLQCIPPDYFTHGCSAEMSDILFRCIDGYVDFSPVIADSIGNTYFEVGNTYRPLSSWAIIGLGFCFTGDMFKVRPTAELLYAPVSLPFVFSHAEIVSHGERRPLLQSTSVNAIAPSGSRITINTQPVHVFPVDDVMPVRMYAAIVLVVQLLLAVFVRRSVRIVSIALFSVYGMMVVAMLLVNVLTRMPEIQGWNWLFLFYNPLPLLLHAANRLRPMRATTLRALHSTLTVWAVVCVAVMTFSSDTVLIGNTLISAVFALQMVIARIDLQHKLYIHTI